ncbi:MAG: sigma 54-interacting transcriptional regulator [Planctomycetota bacterium]
MRITVVEEGTRSSLEIDRPVVRVGRAVDNDIRLASTSASRHHCRLECDEEGTWVVDLGSSNGTQVNGAKVGRQLLTPGDVIAVGGIEIHVEDPAGPPAAPPAPAESFGEAGLATETGANRAGADNLKVFAKITSALASETELQPLLRRIVDSAVALVGGERGFLLLDENPTARGARGAAGAEAMSVRVARQFDRSDIPVPSSRLSMGIAERVASNGRPLLSVDAGRDDRFAAMASVEDLKLRSVLCLPISIEGRTEGVLYVDNRLQRGAFSEEDLDLAELFAGQASVAIRNARLLAELRERNQRLIHSSSQIERLNEQLGRKIRDRDTQLAVVRAELGRERGRYDYTAIVGASDGMRRVFQQLDRIVESELPVLIHGESGTGKELIARAIHYNGPRKERPFVVENCAALPDTLLESELFGHTRGAFTGADRAKKGLIEQADGGTLFLDEIGDMSPEMQKKLLRVLQEGEVRPLGSSQTVKVDVRLISASHQNLDEMVRESNFREALYYRVNVLAVHLPPVRERREDVPLLAEALLARAAREAGRPVPVLSHEVQAALVDYDWPGNVRELENEMRRLMVLAEDSVLLEHLSPTILERVGKRDDADAGGPPEVLGDLRAAVARFERRAIEAALSRNNGNKSRAAKELGISRFALQRKLDKYGVGASDDEQ